MSPHVTSNTGRNPSAPGPPDLPGLRQSLLQVSLALELPRVPLPLDADDAPGLVCAGAHRLSMVRGAHRILRLRSDARDRPVGRSAGRLGKPAPAPRHDSDDVAALNRGAHRSPSHRDRRVLVCVRRTRGPGHRLGARNALDPVRHPRPRWVGRGDQRAGAGLAGDERQQDGRPGTGRSSDCAHRGKWGLHRGGVVPGDSSRAAADGEGAVGKPG